jgi:hypothetical protein
MRSQILVASLLLVLAAGAASGNTISLPGGGILLPNTAGQTLTLVMTGSDTYTDMNLRMKINWGFSPAPVVTAVFGDPELSIPTANLAGSVWTGGSAGISSTGLNLDASFATAGRVPQSTQGMIAVLTVSTVGVPFAGFKLDFTGTELFNGMDPDFEPIPVPLQADPIFLNWGFGEVTAAPAAGSPIVVANGLLPGIAADLPDAITLSNLNGTETFTSHYLVESATITGPDAALFSIIGGFSPTLVTFEEFVKYGVRFAGAMAPGTYTANLQFTFDTGDTTTAPISYPLTVTVVPEPSTYALLMIGVGGVFAIQRRRDSRSMR